MGIERGVPGGLGGLRPLPVGWRCRSMQPAGGSTLPRRRCSRAGLRAGRRRRLPWPEVRLDLQTKMETIITCLSRPPSAWFSTKPSQTFSKNVFTGKTSLTRKVCEMGNDPTTGAQSGGTETLCCSGAAVGATLY